MKLCRQGFSILTLLSNIQNLKYIKGIEFTPREIDVLACIVNNRGIKKMASLLSVAPSTAETHVRNIMLKTRGGSRDGVIDFVERSEKLKCLNTHYVQLIIEALFIKSLAKIALLIPSQTTIHANYSLINKAQLPIFEKIIGYLSLSKISVTKNKPVEQNNFLCSLCPVSVDFLEDMKGNLTERAPLPIFYLNFGTEPLAELEEKSVLDLKNFTTQYDFIFALFKKILPKINYYEVISTFKQEVIALDLPSPAERENVSLTPEQKKPSKKKFLGLFIWGLISIFPLLFFFKSTLFESGNAGQQNGLKAEQTWNLPPLIEYYTQRDDLTKAAWAQLQNQMDSKDSVIVGLYGLGGIGKTSIATHLVHKPQQTYGFRGWFSAENPSLLKASYIELGEKYNLFSPDTSENLKIKLVKEWLEAKESSLLIYDNAPNMALLKGYLPNKGHIIITSRNYKIQGALEVDVMTEAEAFTLLDQLVPESVKQAPNYKEEARQLLKELGYLPLAISQSGSYINENGLTLSNYRRLYETGHEKLLLEKSLPAGDQHQPIYVTWDLNIKSIAALENGKEALDLLNFIATCHSENIPKKLLIHYLFGDVTNETEIAFNKVLKILRQHSLVRTSPDFVSIHRLVHNWVQLKQTDAKKLKTLERSILTIKSAYPYLINKSKSDMDFARYLQPHIKSILENAKSFFNDIKAVELIAALGDSYSIIGNYNKSLKLFKHSFNIIKDNSKASNDFKYFVYTKLASVNTELGQYDESIDILKSILPLIELKNYDKKALIFIKIAYTYLEMGAPKLSQENISKALSIYKSNPVITPENFAWAYTLQAFLLHNANLHEKARHYFEKSLEICDQYLPKNHIQRVSTLQAFAKTICVLEGVQAGEKILEKALKICQQNPSNMHNILSIIYYQKAHIEFLKENYKQSIEFSEKSIALLKKHYGPIHLRIARNMCTLVMAYKKTGDFKKAHEISRDVMEMYRVLNHSEIFHAFEDLGDLFIAEGKSQQALKAYRAAKQILIKERPNYIVLIKNIDVKINHLSI